MTLKCGVAIVLIGSLFLGCSAAAQQVPGETPALEAAPAMPAVSKENASAPAYPGIVDCHSKYGPQSWSNDAAAYRDVIVSINYGTLPFSVDLSPSAGVDMEGFSACALEMVRDGKVPMKVGSIFATGFRNYLSGEASTSIPKAQGRLTIMDVRKTLYPMNGQQSPGSAINRCFALHAPHPSAGAILIRGHVEKGKVKEPKIIASTIRIREVEACMLQVVQSIPFDEELEGTFNWPATYRH